MSKKSDRPPLEEVGLDHNMTLALNHLFKSHKEFCGMMQISPWDLCCVLSNVQAMILANSKDMPRDKGLQRIASLNDVVTTVYDVERAKIHGTGTETKQ